MSILLSEAAYAHYSAITGPTYPYVADRVYPRRLPRDATLPALTFQVIPSVGPLKVHSDQHSDDGPDSLFMQHRMQWDVWAETYNEMEDIARALRRSLAGFSGYWGTLHIGSIHTDLDFDSYDQDTDHYRRIIDCQVRYNEVAAGS